MNKKNYTDTERLNWLISTGSYGYIDSSGDQEAVRRKIDAAIDIDAAIIADHCATCEGHGFWLDGNFEIVDCTACKGTGTRQ
jgi:hypothetical protein